MRLIDETPRTGIRGSQRRVRAPGRVGRRADRDRRSPRRALELLTMAQRISHRLPGAARRSPCASPTTSSPSSQDALGGEGWHDVDGRGRRPAPEPRARALAARRARRAARGLRDGLLARRASRPARRCCLAAPPTLPRIKGRGEPEIPRAQVQIVGALSPLSRARAWGWSPNRGTGSRTLSGPRRPRARGGRAASRPRAARWCAGRLRQRSPSMRSPSSRSRSNCSVSSRGEARRSARRASPRPGAGTSGCRS